MSVEPGAGAGSGGESPEGMAARDLLRRVYDQLRTVARRRMALERARGVGHTLPPTALVHEALLRMMPDGGGSPLPAGPGRADRGAGPAADVPAVADGAGQWRDQREFFLAASREMERVLVDHARAKFAAKRGGDPRSAAGWKRVPMDVVDLAEGADPGPALALRGAILRLEEEDPEAAAVVRLRFFAGLSAEQTALALGVSERTVVRDWAYARAFLAAELERGEADDR
jgi:RNA polymerase sigma factor (TIGR02999 family)